MACGVESVPRKTRSHTRTASSSAFRSSSVLRMGRPTCCGLVRPASRAARRRSGRAPRPRWSGGARWWRRGSASSKRTSDERQRDGKVDEPLADHVEQRARRVLQVVVDEAVLTWSMTTMIVRCPSCCGRAPRRCLRRPQRRTCAGRGELREQPPRRSMSRSRPGVRSSASRAVRRALSVHETSVGGVSASALRRVLSPRDTRVDSLADDVLAHQARGNNNYESLYFK